MPTPTTKPLTTCSYCVFRAPGAACAKCGAVRTRIAKCAAALFDGNTFHDCALPLGHDGNHTTAATGTAFSPDASPPGVVALLPGDGRVVLSPRDRLAPMTNPHELTAAARELLKAGCTCRGTHDDSRPRCALNRAWEALRVAVERIDAGGTR